MRRHVALVPERVGSGLCPPRKDGAGVPGPTLLVVAVLVAANIPIEALPILFGVDRIFDMLRTAVNITGDAACATIVDQFRQEEK